MVNAPANSMIFRLFSRNREAEATFASLYGAIVAQARSPAFYDGFGVPDTVAGRFDMIVLHLFLFFRQIGEGEDARAMRQGVFDAFCRDIEHNFREMGIGDLAVPKRMREVGEAFYGRAQAYDAALAEAGPGPLTSALARNIFGLTEATPSGAARLAAYVRAALARQGVQKPDFPDPESIGRPGQE